jgi:hypothetical protein
MSRPVRSRRPVKAVKEHHVWYDLVDLLWFLEVVGDLASILISVFGMFA